ncbi:double-strand break repair protein AddB [Acetobacteraceae bacterium]|nr:double-strand break repair protein AddB [Acetobacteraceae bacterium]
MSLHSLPLQASFFETIARAWLAEGKGKSRLENYASDEGMILVPGRRAGRHLSEAFLRVLDGKAILLPRIAVIGDLEERAPIAALNLLVNLPPAISPFRRTAVLSRLVKLFQETSKESTPSAKNLWALARSLGELIDEADRAEVSLLEAVQKAQEERTDLSKHWEQIARFLEIVTKAWPEILKNQEKAIDPIAREVEILKILAEDFEKYPPKGRVWAVGFVDGSTGIGNFLAKVARLESGRVVLRGVDTGLSAEIWAYLPQSHPQFLFKDLCERMNLSREEIEPWDLPLANKDGTELSSAELENVTRETFWRKAFSHKMQMGTRMGEEGRIPAPEKAPENVYLIEAEEPQEEARAIALALRDAVETPSKTAALITPDRSLALRVNAALKRFGINADDSAGATLAETPSAVFLRLVVEAACTKFEPVALLALLKHPLTSLGIERVRCLSLTRLLELKILRGSPIEGGLAGFRAKIQSLNSKKLTVGQKHELEILLEALETAFAPLKKIFEAHEKEAVAVKALLDALIETAENLSLTPENLEESKEDRYGRHYRLWHGEDGRRLSEHLSELREICEDLPDQPLQEFGGFLAETMRGISITGLRNYLNGEEVSHPRVFILGILEARLLDFDTLILGGLNEGTWPPVADCGPWMSRLMRKVGGLFLPERRLGAFAQDFQVFACGTGRVIFSRSLSNAEKPEIAASWLVRAQALMGKGKNFPLFKSLAWAKALDGVEKSEPAKAPKPRPPVVFRPRSLAVTAIENLYASPYAIYAKYILQLSPLSGLGEEKEVSDFGDLVHRGLQLFFERSETSLQSPSKEENFEKLKGIFANLIEKKTHRTRLKLWWMPRLKEIAALFVESEEQSFAEGREQVFTEILLSYHFKEIDFKLVGKADRLDLVRTENGKKAIIFDYKTGSLPKAKDVLEGRKPQLLLEGAVLERGGFEGLSAFEIENLIYWRLKGSGKDKEQKESLFSLSKKVPETGKEQGEEIRHAMSKILEKLRAEIEQYDSPETPYEVRMGTGPYDPYPVLERVCEWR